MNPLLRFVKATLRSGRERRKRAPADVVVVSFPKSGRTWLRVMIGKALCDLYDLPESELLDTPALTRAAGLPVATFCHDGGSNMEARHLERLPRRKDDYADKKVLLLARDPRDVVVSCYYQASRRRRLFRGSLSEFVRHPRYGIRKILTWYGIWDRNRQVPRAFCVVRYEDLKQDPEAELRGVLAFLGVEAPDPRAVQAAVEYARFDNMRRMEEQRQFRGGRLRPGQGGGTGALKTRRGRVGGYREELSPDDLAFCGAALDELGYPFADGR